MAMVVNHNIAAMNTLRNLNQSNRAMSGSLQKLSSGYRINTGADGPADLIISEQLRAQNVGLERAVRNTQEAQNVIGIAEGALNEMNEILKTMRQLALHAANNGITSPEQVAADQSEVDSSIQTIDRIANTTKYSDQFLLNGAQELNYVRSTTVDQSNDHNLLDLGLTRVDQIFKREGFSLNINFAGADSSDALQYENQATRAYFEADNNNGDLDINGNKVSDDQSFILTGANGSRQFKFSDGALLGSVAESINNTSDSTGVKAQLVFSGGVSPTLQQSAWDATHDAGNIEIYGANLNDSLAANQKISAATVNISGGDVLAAGLNLDGHGQMYAKLTDDSGDGTWDYYKDKDLTMKIGTWDGTDFVAANGSGLDNSSIELSDEAGSEVGDVLTIAFAGMELDENGTDYIDTDAMSLTNVDLSGGASVINGVELGRNTDANGYLYFRATGTESAKTIKVYKDASMNDDSLVASGTRDLSGGGGGTIRLEETTLDNGEGSGLNIALTFDGAIGDSEQTGSLHFDDLGIRLYSEDYGKEGFVSIQNQEGNLWSYYEDEDSASATLVNEGATARQEGQNAKIVVNGTEIETTGLNAEVSTQDFTGNLVFDKGMLGESRVAQTGYEIGGMFSRATSMQYVTGGETATNNTFSYATQARHETTEAMGQWKGGMQFQLGEGSGDQERTVYSIGSMAVSNMGTTKVTDDFEGKGIIETRELTLQDVLGGSVASLATDPVKALDIIDSAINDVSTLRARLGAFQKNMLQTNANSLNVAIENITATESDIRDADMAAESTDFTKNQILVQAGTAMLAQANVVSQNVLQLLG